MYTTSIDEEKTAQKTLSYNQETQPGLVATTSSDCRCGNNLKPVYRVYRPAPNEDHFYTTSDQEAANAVSKLGYNREGIAFYCASNTGECGASLAFHRYLRKGKGDFRNHYYTTSLNDGSSSGGTYEGILCYIWPN